jgi:quinol monooxygenase YgiN
MEEGCLRFDILEDYEDPNLYYTYRVFDKIDNVMAHRRTAHYQEWDNFKNNGGAISMNHK